MTLTSSIPTAYPGALTGFVSVEGGVGFLFRFERPLEGGPTPGRVDTLTREPID